MVNIHRKICSLKVNEANTSIFPAGKFLPFSTCICIYLKYWIADKKLSASSSRNLWVSGLATTTRATDLKQVFSKYGKVIGAKVVTNARTPGARCYGYVTMSNPDDATKAVLSLHHTELHGRLISVEKVRWWLLVAIVGICWRNTVFREKFLKKRHKQ